MLALTDRLRFGVATSSSGPSSDDTDSSVTCTALFVVGASFCCLEIGVRFGVGFFGDGFGFLGRAALFGFSGNISSSDSIALSTVGVMIFFVFRTRFGDFVGLTDDGVEPEVVGRWLPMAKKDCILELLQPFQIDVFFFHNMVIYKPGLCL